MVNVPCYPNTMFRLAPIYLLFRVGLLADFIGISTNTYGGSKGVLMDMQKDKIRGDRKEVERLKPILQEELKIEADKLKRKKAELSNK